jgi:fibrillarin-like pre-rRNA processing protein
VVTDPKQVISRESKKLKDNGFYIEQIINLEPFDKDHGLIYGIYRPTL